MSNTHDMMSDWARAPPPSGPAWLRAAKVLYNPDDNSILGRTPKRWGIVLTFYFVFYAVLAAMFAACMAGLFLTLDNSRPAFTLHQSLIGANPGMSFRPFPLDGFEVRTDVENATEVYIKQLDDYLKTYPNAIPTGMETCVGPDRYGFPRSPCFFIKLNKIFDWVPEYYDVSGLPEDMPDDLKEHIKGLDHSQTKSVWVSCSEEPQSNGTLGTIFSYPWGRSLVGTFPFTNGPVDIGPFLPVVVTPPVNIAVNIRCRAWAKNIIYKKSLKEPSGYTRFRLFLAADDATETTTAEP
ncbi:sodium/potassium-transporting ATPase subunit beta-1 [Amyelois transitella]|uniref:sodium/potassium-transporting ATPase subunit beta-1 n=1 Tax=Amyelois transitella TaxID=680683 RepID=UPI00298F5362|nr:sodium/potassium-transporting ATPase subunit beta-1 [Amyelois transitella]